MLRNTKQLRGFAIQALDGELGTVDQFYFDDVTWTVRYLVVETGAFRDGRRVLLSPISILHLDAQDRRLDVDLTLMQVMESPAINTEKPISRQHETAYLQHYGYRAYWNGADLWGSSNTPGSLAISVPAGQEALVERLRRESSHSHLRSTASVNGYSMRATDCTFGHLNGFIVDDESWAVRYIEVATRDWCAGKTVLVSAAWIKDLSWDDLMIYIGLSGETIQSAPEYAENMPISREYEHQLYLHYGQPPYWLHEDEEAHSLASA